MICFLSHFGNEDIVRAKGVLTDFTMMFYSQMLRSQSGVSRTDTKIS